MHISPNNSHQQPRNRNLLSGADGHTLVVPLDEVEIVAGPVEGLEPRREPEEQGLAGAVEVVAHSQRARG